jgi:hypothetical protein
VQGGCKSAAFAARGPNIMKQYLIMKMVEGLNQVAGMIALPGFYTLEAAQQFIMQAITSDPESKFLIQEVGAA